MAPVSSSSQYQEPPTKAQPLAAAPEEPSQYQSPPSRSHPVVMAPLAER